MQPWRISSQDYLLFEKLGIVSLKDPVVGQVKEGEGGLHLGQVADQFQIKVAIKIYEPVDFKFSENK